jgi:putative hydrolase of the HAD superfamily
MKKTTAITCLFLDIGDVLLTNGWDHHARKLAATNFKLELAEMEDRHHLTFDTYEDGKLTLEEYLGRVVFYQKPAFTRAQFRRFMFAQSKPYPEMIGLVRKLKAKYGLEIVVVSNEARELNLHRIRKFKLDGFVDSFVSSCFVHVRKPDVDRRSVKAPGYTKRSPRCASRYTTRSRSETPRTTMTSSRCANMPWLSAGLHTRYP